MVKQLKFRYLIILLIVFIAGCESKKIEPQTMLTYGDKFPVEIRYFHTSDDGTVEHSITYPKSIEEICKQLSNVRIVREAEDKSAVGSKDRFILIFENAKNKEFLFEGLFFSYNGVLYVTDGAFRFLQTVEKNVSK